MSLEIRALLPALLALGLSTPATAQPGHWPAWLGVERGRIGAEVQAMTPELREHFGAPRDRGVLVARLVPDRPAARAGLRVGDVLVAAGGEPLDEPFDLLRAVARPGPGEKIELSLLRDGKKKTLSVELEGEAMPWVDPGAWRGWLEHGMRQGRDEILRRLDELERRLRDVESHIEHEKT